MKFAKLFPRGIYRFPVVPRLWLFLPFVLLRAAYGSPPLDINSPQVQVVMAIQDRVTDEWMRQSEVLGTAVGLDSDGLPALVVFIDREAARAAEVVGSLPKSIDSIKVLPKLTGKFRALGGDAVLGGHTVIQTPPIQLGTSGGWRFDQGTVVCCGGTLGALVAIGSTQYVLSNHHVLEGHGAQTGASIIQPGLGDVGCNANNAQTVATFLTRNSLPSSNVDCAIAQVVPGMVRTDGSILEVGTISSQTLSAALSQNVKKSGRTTGLTHSNITEVNGIITINYNSQCGGPTAFQKTFTGQIFVANSDATFSCRGDSGSLLLEDVPTNPRAIGLLFAGNQAPTDPGCTTGSIAIANPIGEVLSFLGATMVGQGGTPPSNDQCSGAIALSNGVARMDSTVNATSTGDPGTTTTCSTPAPISSGVWYKFTPGSNGTVTVSTCGGSDYDTVLEVYTGTCAARTAIACNDDNGPICSGGGGPASLTFTGTAGTTYLILAAGYAPPGTGGTLRIVASTSSTPTPTPTGSLQVTISPAAAVSAGAQWQVDGGSYQNSGVTLSNLSVGTHTVAFKPVSDWITPSNQLVTINANQTTQTTGTYTTSTPCGGTFSNAAPITINDTAAASPYPSTINVTGVGTIPSTPGAIQVTINGYSHSFSSDVGMVLVGPTGAAFNFQDGPGDQSALVNVTYTVSDTGATQLPQSAPWGPGTYQPADYFGDNYPAPGPGTTYNSPPPRGSATFASTFGGTNANGTWSLYVIDAVSGVTGNIAGGWTLTFSGAGCATPTPTPPVGGSLVVTNTNSQGAGSLASALSTANSDPSHKTISFNLPGSGPWTITVSSPLLVTAPVTIDGPLQANRIYVEGAPGVANIFDVRNHSGTTIKGLGIYYYDSTGVLIDNANGVQIENCYIGFKQTSGAILLNRVRAPFSTGISIRGSLNQVHRSTVSGVYNGIVVGEPNEQVTGFISSDNLFEGNNIGTDPTGQTTIGYENTSNGISLRAGTKSSWVGGWTFPEPSGFNVIAGNGGSGILIGHPTADHNRVFSNYLGLNRGGTAVITGSTNQQGILIENGAQYNAAWSNFISGNRSAGITVASSNNWILGNIIGLNQAQTQPLSGQPYGILLKIDILNTPGVPPQGNPIGGSDPNPPYYSFGNVICNQSLNGIEIQNGASNGVMCNWIGVSTSGQPFPNGGWGAYLLNSSGNSSFGCFNAWGPNGLGRVGGSGGCCNSIH